MDFIDLRLLSLSHQRFGDLNYIGVKESIKRFVMLQEDLTLWYVDFIDPFVD